MLQGTLDMLILKVVAFGPTHGYAIAQRLQQMSQDVLQVQQGSLYPALHRLEETRLGESGVGGVGHRPGGAFLFVDPCRTPATRGTA